MIGIDELLFGCGLSVAFGFFCGYLVSDLLHMKRQEKLLDDEVIEPFSMWKKRSR